MPSADACLASDALFRCHDHRQAIARAEAERTRVKLSQVSGELEGRAKAAEATAETLRGDLADLASRMAVAEQQVGAAREEARRAEAAAEERVVQKAAEVPLEARTTDMAILLLWPAALARCSGPLLWPAALACCSACCSGPLLLPLLTYRLFERVTARWRGCSRERRALRCSMSRRSRPSARH